LDNIEFTDATNALENFRRCFTTAETLPLNSRPRPRLGVNSRQLVDRFVRDCPEFADNQDMLIDYCVANGTPAFEFDEGLWNGSRD
jgi:hypothetical protein